MVADSDGFLGRWARRKALARTGAELPAEPARAPAQPPSQVAPALTAAPVPKTLAQPQQPAMPAPTLADAQQLTSASDFRPFVARAVAPEVRNAAFKKLFADPCFNVMDGLDIYIDDYSKPDPLPLELARELLAAQFPTARAEAQTQVEASQAAVEAAPARDETSPRAAALSNEASASARVEPQPTSLFPDSEK